MNRNYLFWRSVGFSLATKSAGFFVVFTCLPLAALSLTSQEFATFNYSMSVGGLFAIVFLPPSAFLVGQFARHASLENWHDHVVLAERSLTIFLLLALALIPIAVAIVAYLAPVEFRLSLILATASMVGTATLSWADVYRLGLRKDYISSLFALGNNACMIVSFLALYKLHRLSYAAVMLIYYVSPLAWAAISFGVVVAENRLRVRIRGSKDSFKEIALGSIPLAKGALGDYVKLNVSSLVAFNVFSPADYNVYSTITLLVARIVNPVSLLTRPLIPAYIDAIVTHDERWIGSFKSLMGLAVLLFFAILAVTSVLASVYLPASVHFGVLSLSGGQLKFYVVVGLLSLGVQVFLAFLYSIYLGAHRMETFGNVSLLANVTGVVVGTVAYPEFGAPGLFAALTVCNTISAVYLFLPFIRDPFALGASNLSATRTQTQQ